MKNCHCTDKNHQIHVIKGPESNTYYHSWTLMDGWNYEFEAYNEGFTDYEFKQIYHSEFPKDPEDKDAPRILLIEYLYQWVEKIHFARIVNER